MAFEMTKMMEREMHKYTENVVKEMTKYLAQEYGFNGEEAVEKLMGKGMKKSTEKSSVADEEVPVKDEKKRGRPKKEKKVVSANAADDLIASLVAQAQQTQAQQTQAQQTHAQHAADDFIASCVAQAQSQQASASEEVDTSEEADALEDALAVKAEADALAVKEKADALAVKEKDVKEQAKLAKKAQQEQDKLAKKAQQEQEKELAKLAKKAQQEQDKLAKKAQQEKEKELAKLAKKAQQEQDKLANGGKGAAPPQEEKKEKKEKLANGGKGAAPPQEQDKLANGGKGAAPPQEQDKLATPSAIEELSSQMGQLELEEESVEEEASISVKKFEFQGTVYLRSSDDVLYDLKSQEPVGMWNEEEQCIDEIEVEED